MREADLRVLSFTTVFPRPSEPNLGSFVRSRLQWMARDAAIEVVSPVPLLDYGNPGHILPDRSRISRSRRDGDLTVHHPAWLYPPGFGGLNPWLLAAAAGGLLSRLHRNSPIMVIDAHFGFPDGAAAALLARRLGCPFTVTLRGNETAHGSHRVRRAWMQWALRRAARVISVAASLQDYAISLGVVPERTSVIPNGIDPAVFHPRDRVAARQRIGMAEDRLHLLSIGYLIERKGHHRVVQALPALHAAGVPADLWIVGNPGREGDFAGQIRSTVSELGLEPFVHFVPAVPPAEVAEFLTAADVFCLASNREGWPNVVNEALACGCPVVACDVGGVRDMLPERRYGRVTASGDAAALQAALKDALRSDWNRGEIAAWGQSRSWAHVAAEALGQLRDVAYSARGRN